MLAFSEKPALKSSFACAAGEGGRGGGGAVAEDAAVEGADRRAGEDCDENEDPVAHVSGRGTGGPPQRAP